MPPPRRVRAIRKGVAYELAALGLRKEKGGRANDPRFPVSIPLRAAP